MAWHAISIMLMGAVVCAVDAGVPCHRAASRRPERGTAACFVGAAPAGNLCPKAVAVGGRARATQRPKRKGAAACASGEAGGARRQLLDVKQALQTVYGQGNGQFWEYRKLAIEQASVAAPDSLSVDTGDLTYGEFDLDFFCRMLEMAAPRKGDVFCDVGSGNGRLVLAAATTYPSTLALARGVEIVPALHEAALEAKSRAMHLSMDLSPVDLVLADVHERQDLLLDVDVCFCYSTAFSASGPYLSQLSMTFGLGMREGSRVMTVDKMLLSDGPWQFQEIGSIDAKNSEVGMSTGYVYRVVKSPNAPRS